MEIIDKSTITLLIGAFIGFLFSVWKDVINSERTEEKTEKKFKLELLNEAFILIGRIVSKTRKTHLYILNEQKAELKNDDDTARLSFILRVYFPNLCNEYESFVTTIVDYGMKSSILSFQYSKDNQTYKLENAVNSINVLLQEDNKKLEKIYRKMGNLVIEETKKFL